MGSLETQHGKVTRRQLLRLVAISAIGAGVVLATGRLASATSSARDVGETGKASGSSFIPTAATTTTSTSGPVPTTATSGSAAGTPPSHPSPQETKVKAVYFQMPLVVSTSQEYFVLQSPAHFRDLLADVLEEHPALSPMIPNMMVLIDGVPAKPDTPLRDGDEVDFIPAIAGG